jgi:hypothetical protein
MFPATDARTPRILHNSDRSAVAMYIGETARNGFD